MASVHFRPMAVPTANGVTRASVKTQHTHPHNPYDYTKNRR